MTTTTLNEVMGRPKKVILDKKGKGRGRGKYTAQCPTSPIFEKPTDDQEKEEDGNTCRPTGTPNNADVNRPIEDSDVSVMSSAADGEFPISQPLSPPHTDYSQPSTSTLRGSTVTSLGSSHDSVSEDSNFSKKRKRSKSYLFTEQQETDLAEWYKDHEILYNRRHPESHNSLKKKEIIVTKTKTFDKPPTYEQMLTWMDNMRTQFGKVTNASSKSGRGTSQNLTSRDIWIKDTFDFLRPYIKRQQTRASAQFPEKAREVEEFAELSEDDNVTVTEKSIGRDVHGQATKKRNKTDTSVSQAADAIDKLINRADELSVIRQNIEKPKNLTPQEDKVRKYVEYISTELIKIPEQLWLKYTMDHMGLVHSYIERGSIAQNNYKSAIPPLRVNPNPYSQSTSQDYQNQHRPYNYPQAQQITGDILFRPTPSLHFQSGPNQSSSMETDIRSSGALDLTSTSLSSGEAQFSFRSLLNPNGQSNF